MARKPMLKTKSNTHHGWRSHDSLHHCIDTPCGHASTNLVVWMALAILLGYGLLGFIDDWKKVMLRSSDGLAGRWKLVGQFGIGGAVLGYGYITGVISPELALPF